MRKKVIPPQAVILPDELMEEILLRLPVKSLLRFKCVSKSWLSLISNPQFTKSHFDVAATPTQRLLLTYSNNSKVNSIDIEAPSYAAAVFNIPNPSPSPESGCRIDVVGSCRGFLLLNSEFSDFIYFVIWNPSTGLQKRFNKRFDKQLNHRVLCGIGYDSSIDDVVVTLLLPPPPRSGLLGMEVHCFSSRTNSWSCIESTVTYRDMPYEFRYGSLLNGALHWLVHSYDYNHCKIIAFDMIERRISEIPLPHDLAIKLQAKIYRLKVMGGCLCLWFPGYGTAQVEIWTMKEYKVQSSWTQLSVLSNYCHPLYECCVYTESLLSLSEDFQKSSEDEQQ